MKALMIFIILIFEIKISNNFGSNEKQDKQSKENMNWFLVMKTSLTKQTYTEAVMYILLLYGRIRDQLGDVWFKCFFIGQTPKWIPINIHKTLSQARSQLDMEITHINHYWSWTFPF